MHPYQPSGKSGPNALVVMIFWGLAGTIATAFVGGIITKWIDLIILFALGMGLFAGLAVKSGARAGHCRNRVLIGSVAVVMGLLVYGGKLYANYHNERLLAIESLESKTDPSTKAFTRQEAETALDEYYQIKTGSKGFIGWLKMLLDRGISISHHGAKGINLGWIGSLILLMIEAGFAAGTAWAVAVAQVDEPYCERCLRWSEKGWVRSTTIEAFQPAAEQLMGTSVPVEGALSALPVVDDKLEHGEFSLLWCPTCREGYLSGSLIGFNEKKEKSEVKVFSNLHLTPDELKTLATEVESETDSDDPEGDPDETENPDS